MDADPHAGGLIMCSRDIDGRKQAQKHVQVLATISRNLTAAVTSRDVAEVLVTVVPLALGTAFVSVVLLDEPQASLHTVASNGLPMEGLQDWSTFPLSSPVPLAAAVRDGRAVFTASRQEGEERFPALRNFPSAHEASAALPLKLDGRTHGALGLSFPTPRLFDEAEQTFLEAVAAQGAQALERIHLLEAARRAAERATFLAQAGELLAFTLDPQAVLSQLATLAVPRLADICIVYLPDVSGLLTPHAISHHTPGLVQQLRTHLDRFPIDMNAPIGAARVYRDRQPSVVHLPSEEILRTAAINDDHVAAVLAIGIRSVVDVPLVTRGEALGVIEFMSLRDDRHYDNDDVMFAQELAQRAALALDNARLYQAAQTANEALERTVQDRTRQLMARTEELTARNRALDAFGVLSRDLAVETDRVKLIHRAQEILLTLLPKGIIGYFEPDGKLWRLRCLTGEWPDRAFRAELEEGLKRGETPSFDTPFDTGTPLYLDLFAPDPQHLSPDAIARLHSAAAFPVGTGDLPFGVLVIALYDQHGWTPSDRALLETALSKVRLALQRAEAVEGLARRTAELEEVNRELDAFTATVAHDLRAPLRHMESFSVLLRRALGNDLPERAARHLSMIESSSTRMNLLVEALLTFAGTSRQALNVQEVDLNVLIREALTDLNLSGHVDLRVGPLPVVRGDAVLLRQVLVNLLGNAVKYSGTRERPMVTVGAQDRPDEVELVVEDNGVGFDPQYADRLFGMFSRLHSTQEYEGSGVGLATVKRVVQRHGGRVWAESTPGEGARFFVALPRST